MQEQNDDFIILNQGKYDLKGIEALAWKKLVNGSIKKKNGFRTMCVSTISKNSDTSLRIVVNRKVDEIQKTIFFYTDNRSRKYTDLQNDNRVSILFYDAKQRVQITVKARATLHTNDDLAKEKWRSTSAQARLGYMTIDPPNTKSDKPTLGYNTAFATEKPSEIESDLFKNNFSVIACQVYELEFLYLDYSGNRKANFFYTNGQLTDSSWVVP